MFENLKQAFRHNRAARLPAKVKMASAYEVQLTVNAKKKQPLKLLQSRAVSANLQFQSLWAHDEKGILRSTEKRISTNIFVADIYQSTDIDGGKICNSTFSTVKENVTQFKSMKAPAFTHQNSPVALVSLELNYLKKNL